MAPRPIQPRVVARLRTRTEGSMVVDVEERKTRHAAVRWAAAGRCGPLE